TRSLPPPPGFALEHMELRPDASHKENVPPRPAASLRPGKRFKSRRLRKSLGVGLASRRGRWVPVGPAERGGPAATPCLGTALRQEPCRVQSNLASPSPSLGLVLRDMTGRLTNSSFRQQDNLQPLVGRRQGRVQDFAIQQSNLCARETHTAECGRLTSPQLWSEPQESFRPHLMPQGSPLPRGPLARPSSNLRQSWLLATDTSCPDIGLATGLAPLNGPTWSDPRSRCGLGGWTSRLVGEPLTLKDLAVPAQSPSQAPSQAAIHQLLVCIQRLECQAVRLRCQVSREFPAQGILPGREGGDGTPRERISREKERPASRNSLQVGARGSKARNTVNLEPELGRWQWLSRCFRAWWRWAHRRRAVAAAVALGRRQLLRRGLRALQWALWLREAQLEAAWGRHTQALLAQTFQKVRNLQIGAWRGDETPVPGSLREEAGDKPIPLCSGSRPGGGDRGVLILQALHQLAGWGGPPHTWHSPAAGAAWVALLDPQHPSACLCRCFGAWQRFVQRGTRYRAHVANRQAGTLRTCLQQWVQMKQLRASDGVKVAQLSLCWQKAGNMTLFSSVPEGATVHELRLMATARVLPQEQGRGSLQEACRRLALQRALLLWRTRLSQRQRADSFFEGMQWRALRHILRGWRLRARDAGSARIASAPDPLGGALGGEAPSGHSTHRRSSWDKASRAPALLEMLQLSFLWAAGRRQQGQCLLLWRARAQQSRDAVRWHQSKLQRRILLDWSHWATAQGARRELAARWAWNRRGRAALGLWRQRLVQRREVEWRARERGRRLQQRALGHWHCYWQRQVFLQEKCQRWVQARLQGLRRAVFWGWQQAAARRRPAAASSEQLLLHRHFQAWCGVVKASWAKRPAFQDGLRQIPGATFASEAQAATAQPRDLRVARASCWRSREQGCQADRQLRRTWAQQAFVARQVAPGLCCKAHRQAGESSRAQALCWMLWAYHAVLTPSARVLETWTQSATQGHVQRTAITHFQQAGPRRFLRTHWAQWRTALLRVTEKESCQVTWVQVFLFVPSDPQLQATGHGAQPNPAPQPQIPGAQAQAWGSALYPDHEQVVMAIRTYQGLSPQEEIPALPAGQAPGSHVAALGRCSGGREAGMDTPQAVAPEMGLATVAGARPAVAGGSAVTATGGWPGPFPGTGRLPHPQQALPNRATPAHSRAAPSLAAAFNKWHQCLAARGLRDRASSSMRPWSKAGLRRPGSRPEAARAPALGGPGAEKGAQLQL
ncbi:hypothetical protein FD754_019627, partial [Muntiacus muntjak]